MTIIGKRFSCGTDFESMRLLVIELLEEMDMKITEETGTSDFIFIVSENKTKKCKACTTKIPQNATYCQECGYNQGR